MEDLQKCFIEVQSIDWETAIVSFYIVKRNLAKGKATYKVSQVNADENMRKKLRDISVKKIRKSNKVLEYDFQTVDLDDNLLGISTSETDMQYLIDKIVADETIIANSYDDLLDSWIYISCLEKDDNRLFSVRYISSSWKTKKVRQWDINVIFKDNMLIDIQQDDILKIDNKIDFFSFNGSIFIADKKVFETALNFRAGMEKNRDEIIEEFKELKLFVNVDEIATLVGSNLPRLRKLSKVKKSGYYKEQEFLKNLKLVNDEEKWGIKYSDDGKLVVNKDNIDDLLIILNNSRLKSPINQESFDVDSKHKLESSKNK